MDRAAWSFSSRLQKWWKVWGGGSEELTQSSVFCFSLDSVSEITESCGQGCYAAAGTRRITPRKLTLWAVTSDSGFSTGFLCLQESHTQNCFCSSLCRLLTLGPFANTYRIKCTKDGLILFLLRCISITNSTVDDIELDAGPHANNPPFWLCSNPNHCAQLVFRVYLRIKPPGQILIKTFI